MSTTDLSELGTGTGAADGGQPDGGALRKQLEKVLDENKALKSDLLAERFHRAGINPDEGIGKLLRSAYDGESDVAKIREFAEQYGVKPQAAAGDGDGDGDGGQGGDGQGQGQALSDEERQRQESLARLRDAQAGSESPPPPDSNTRLREAEKKGQETGDWSDFDRLQAEAIFAR